MKLWIPIGNGRFKINWNIDGHWVGLILVAAAQPAAAAQSAAAANRKFFTVLSLHTL